MSPHQAHTGDITGGKMKIPQAVIAQAEAAATSNQPEGSQHHNPLAPNQTSKVLASKEIHSHSLASGPKYAHLTSFPLLPRTPLARLKG